MAVTMKDIADKVGVSKTTVSRVLNNKNNGIKISEKTKEKVLNAAKELNYKPNFHAKALSSNNSYMLGLIVDYLDPFYNDIIQGVEEYAKKNNYNLVLSIVGNKNINEVADTLIKKSAVEGVLIAGTKKLAEEKSVVNELEKRGALTVLVGHHIKNVPSVNINNELGGEIATEYLIDLGFHKIAIITGPKVRKRRDSKERLDGFLKTIKNKSLNVNEKYIIEGNFTYESGYSAMSKLLELKDKPEAVVVCDDQMALGAISAINENELSVPKDISIIGFDDIIQAKYCNPKLTTIQQPKINMGISSAKLLIDLIEGNEINNKNIIFDPILVERDSCKKIK